MTLQHGGLAGRGAPAAAKRAAGRPARAFTGGVAAAQASGGRPAPAASGAAPPLPPPTPPPAEPPAAHARALAGAGAAATAVELARSRLRRQLTPGPGALERVGRMPDPDAYPRRFGVWLTRRLRACGSWQELQLVWHDYYPRTNVVHVTAAASRLAQLAAGAGGEGGWQAAAAAGAGAGAGALCDRPEMAKFATSLLCCAAGRLHELDARGAANLLHAHAALQRAAPHSSRAAGGALGALAVAAAALAPRMRPQEASNTLWALASLQLGGLLPPRWFDEFEAATAAAAAEMLPCEAAGALWAAARLGRAPGREWLEAVLGGRHMARAGAREVCTILWALSGIAAADARRRAALGGSTGGAAPAAMPLAAALPPSGLGACLNRLVEVLPQSGPADVTQAWLALSRLGLPPPPRLALALLARSAALLPSARPQEAACVLHSLARLGADPGPWWWAAAAPAVARAAALGSPQGVSMLAWAFGRLRPRMEPEAAESILRAVLEASGGALARQARGCEGPGEEAEGLESSSSSGGGGGGGGGGGSSGNGSYAAAFKPQELAALAWGMGRAGAAAPAAWAVALRGACAAAAEAGHFTAGELAMVLVGLGGIRDAGAVAVAGVAPGAAVESAEAGAAAAAGGGGAGGGWSGALLAAARRAMPGAPPGELTALLVGCARLGLAPGREWLSALAGALVDSVAAPRAAGGATGGGEAAGAWAGRDAGKGGLAPRDTALLLWAMARLGLQLSPRLARALLPAAAASAPGMTGADAAMSLWALARMHGGPAGRRRRAAAVGGSGGGRRLPEGFAELADTILLCQRARLARAARAGVGAGEGPEEPAASCERAVLAEGWDAALQLWALSRLGHRPPPGWLDAAWRGALAPALPALAVASPGAIPIVVRAFVELGVTPAADTGWLGAVADATAPGAPVSGSAPGADHARAAAGVGPAAAAEADADTPLARWPASCVAALVHYLSRVEGHVGSGWLAAACGALGRAPALRSLGVVQLASVLTALCRLGYAADAAWAIAALGELRRRQEAGECGGDAECEVWQRQALEVAAAMYSLGRAEEAVAEMAAAAAAGGHGTHSCLRGL